MLLRSDRYREMGADVEKTKSRKSPFQLNRAVISENETGGAGSLRGGSIITFLIDLSEFLSESSEMCGGVGESLLESCATCPPPGDTGGATQTCDTQCNQVTCHQTCTCVNAC